MLNRNPHPLRSASGISKGHAMSTRLHTWWRPLLGLFLLLTIAACGSRVNRENFSRIETGMPEAEVIEILGEPTETSSIDLGLFSGTTATWKHKDTEITVQFFNGKVQTKHMSKTGSQPPQPR